ncbi:MAG: single-stranded DNA-binding protein [Patescibacteria group bacterium]|nr:single-stranded DNA-binding protein [Patescibacteria group bacterium]
MSARSLNKVLLIGNLTRDPELRYTPQGTAVCSFGLATNRQWTTESGEKREEAEFHRIVAWNKLAELCSQLLTKGRKVFVEGRLQTRSWQAPDGQQKTATEIVIDDMIILDSRRLGEEVPAGTTAVPVNTKEPVIETAQPATAEAEESDKKKKKKEEAPATEVTEESQENQEINPDDIPF